MEGGCYPAGCSPPVGMKPRPREISAAAARTARSMVGRRSGPLVEIRSGVEAGDVVVTAGQNRLSNGTPVALEDAGEKEATAR